MSFCRHNGIFMAIWKPSLPYTRWWTHSKWLMMFPLLSLTFRLWKGGKNVVLEMILIQFFHSVFSLHVFYVLFSGRIGLIYRTKSQSEEIKHYEAYALMLYWFFFSKGLTFILFCFNLWMYIYGYKYYREYISWFLSINLCLNVTFFYHFVITTFLRSSIT